MKPLDLTNLKAAFKEFDAGLPDRDTLILNAETTEDVERWQRLEAEALEKLRAAFLEDTKDRNNPNHAKVVDERYLRKLVDKYG